ncbi:MAG: patatin-like phospholipase family protein [Pseudomonadota bacterium]|nr:MAG: patatin-like phospholipase family protein [Pseudomonadota bacterium]
MVSSKRTLLALWLVFGLATFAGCSTTPTAVDGAIDRPRPKVALVLGGGAARGFAHIGVIRALEQEKIPIDLVVGTSVGSLIGALYAQEGNSFELEWTAFTLTKDDLFDYALLGAAMGPVKGDRLEAFVKKNIKVENIEQLKIPFVAVATDLNRGTRVDLDRGSVARAVRASCAIPGVFQPVEHQGRVLVDGGAVDNLPVALARQKGADIVIAVDISQNVTNFNITNLVDVTLQAVNIMFAENVNQRRRGADVVVTPAVGDVSMMDFSQKKRLVQAGIEAGRQAVPAVREAIAAWPNWQSASTVLNY